MPSGRKPNLQRRRQVQRLRSQGLTLGDIARRFGVSKQAIWSLLHARPRVTHTRAVACTLCGTQIISPGALPRDAVSALCVGCLQSHEAASFGQRLKALRLAAGLAQADLARRTGLAPGSLRAYEDDVRCPRHRTVDRLTRVLGDGLVPGRKTAARRGGMGHAS